MNNRNPYIATIIFILALTVACNNKPKVIEQEATTEQAAHVSMTGESASSPDATDNEMHEVVAQEVLQAERYTYMHVSEDGDAYWVAVPKQNIEVGATYYYQGGLRKANFRSTEFDRVFERIVLVSQLARAPSGEGASALETAMARLDDQSAGQGQDPQVAPSEGSVSLKELFDNRQEYAGKTIKVKGRCVKINKNIMGRNWVHLQDGSDPERELDLTVTTALDIPVGAVVEMEGRITLNKDFGAGYKYEVIMEDGHVH